MSYFTAVIAADGRAWRARDVDVEDAGSLDDLAETLRAVAHSEKPVLAVIEHEDEWFALVRVDGDEDARVFVSDLAAAARGPYAEILSSAGEVDTGVVVDDDGEVPPAAAAPADEPTQPTGGVGDLDGLLDEADDDGDLPDDVPDGEIPTGAGDDEVPDVGDLDQPDPPPPPPWAGDAALLDDLGIDKARLCELSEDNTDDPAAALAEIGEQVGFADLLEALR